MERNVESQGRWEAFRKGSEKERDYSSRDDAPDWNGGFCCEVRTGWRKPEVLRAGCPLSLSLAYIHAISTRSLISGLRAIFVANQIAYYDGSAWQGCLMRLSLSWEGTNSSFEQVFHDLVIIQFLWEINRQENSILRYSDSETRDRTQKNLSKLQFPRVPTLRDNALDRHLTNEEWKEFLRRSLYSSYGTEKEFLPNDDAMGSLFETMSRPYGTVIQELGAHSRAG